MPGSQFGFLGISYVTFRALDVVFCLRDKVIALPPTLDFLAFLFFFPTISSGPIDRYRRFTADWRKRRTRAEFLLDLNHAVHRLFRGFFYKFIVAALIKQYWLDRAAEGAGFGALVSYMYAFSLYLFFDFAGYSAFAIAFSYLFGVHTPENFNHPFIARDIRLHAFSARCHAWQMVRGQTHGRNPCLFFSLRLDGALAWDEAALRSIWPLSSRPAVGL